MQGSAMATFSECERNVSQRWLFPSESSICRRHRKYNECRKPLHDNHGSLLASLSPGGQLQARRKRFQGKSADTMNPTKSIATFLWPLARAYCNVILHCKHLPFSCWKETTSSCCTWAISFWILLLWVKQTALPSPINAGFLGNARCPRTEKKNNINISVSSKPPRKKANWLALGSSIYLGVIKNPNLLTDFPAGIAPQFWQQCKPSIFCPGPAHSAVLW